MQSTYAREIVLKLREHGHDAYFVGGCVRDMVMGIEPADYDIATGARPEQVTALFPRTEGIGSRFGVILVIHRGHAFEVATFRSDRAYIDGRRPTGVVFTSAEQDVQRRDFTINGLLYDPVEDRVIDYVDGRADIERRIVRAIGDPYRRFEEDKLRVLRAVRFGARFGYSIDGRTWEAVCAMAPAIHQVSHERIRDEILRVLVEGRASGGFRMLEESGLRAEVLPELVWDRHLEACLESLDAGAAPDFALAVLVHECAVDTAVAIARRLRMSNASVAHLDALVSGQARLASLGQLTVAGQKRVLRQERIDDHLKLHALHTRALGASTESLEFAVARLREWPASELDPPSLISGDDLITLGLEPGPSFRTILAAVEDEQLEGRLADRDSALSFVRELLQ
jgi:poly(A) polymerase